MRQGERWIIFYTDGSTFTCTDGEPWDAPRRSVQSIASVKDRGDDWYNVNQHDYYYWEAENGGWNEADMFTVFDHLIRAKHPLVLFGRMLGDAGWKETHSAIMKYCEAHREFILGISDERLPQTYL